MATTKHARFAKRQIVRKATHERKRKAHKKLIVQKALAEYKKFTVPEGMGGGIFIALFRKMWRDVLRGKTKDKVLKKEAKAKERAKLRKENAKKNS